MGFNGAQLLALTIGGCFCNDLRFVVHESGVALGRIAVTVSVELEGPGARDLCDDDGLLQIAGWLSGL